MKKKRGFLILTFLLLHQLFGENFSLDGKYLPDLYSTIDVLFIEGSTIKYRYETTKKEKIIQYSKYYDSGLLFFKLSEYFPKDINEKYYYYNEPVETSDKLLVLAGLENRGNTYVKDSIMMFMMTAGFDEDSYPFIWPMDYFEISPKYIDCTSYLTEKTHKYVVDNLSNCMVDTPWVEAVEGEGIGEGFTILNERNRAYPYLLLMNGYISYKKPYLYKQNNRIKKLKITGIQSGKSKILDVLDTPHPQTIALSFLPKAEDIHVEIADVYKGTKYDDTCLHFCVPYGNKVIPYENSIGE